MAADSIPMTRAGAEAIKRALKRLKSVERPKNVQDIAVARDHGDLRENAEYHAAKERQSHIEGRIQMLEDRLARAQIIDVSKLSGERVVFGATVKLEDSDSGARTQYTIVGETEADLKKGRISITSPIARGLIGREVGDSVTIRTPGGNREYEILAVEFVEYQIEDESA
jgi:transcription elongation factor GreA